MFFQYVRIKCTGILKYKLLQLDKDKPIEYHLMFSKKNSGIVMGVTPISVIAFLDGLIVHQNVLKKDEKFNHLKRL